MGFHGMSFGSLILLLILIVLVFGTKRIRTMGEDLGEALKGFRKGLHGEETTSTVVNKTETEKSTSSNDTHV